MVLQSIGIYVSCKSNRRLRKNEIDWKKTKLSVVYNFVSFPFITRHCLFVRSQRSFREARECKRTTRNLHRTMFSNRDRSSSFRDKYCDVSYQDLYKSTT